MAHVTNMFSECRLESGDIVASPLTLNDISIGAIWARLVGRYDSVTRVDIFNSNLCGMPILRKWVTLTLETHVGVDGSGCDLIEPCTIPADALWHGLAFDRTAPCLDEAIWIASVIRDRRAAQEAYRESFPRLLRNMFHRFALPLVLLTVVHNYSLHHLPPIPAKKYKAGSTLRTGPETRNSS